MCGREALEANCDISSPIGHSREKMVGSLLSRWKISQPQNQCSNLLLAHVVNQIVQTLISVKYFQWSAMMYVNVEGFVETCTIQ